MMLLFFCDLLNLFLLKTDPNEIKFDFILTIKKKQVFHGKSNERLFLILRNFKKF